MSKGDAIHEIGSEPVVELSAAVPPLIDLVREKLGARFVIDRELGRGGMSIVYLAHDRARDQHVALKILRPELFQSTGATRFLREIEIEGRLQHPNILPLYDSGSVEGILYYTMPFVGGETLRERLHLEKQLPLEDAISVAADVAAALDAAHAHGVIHRDVKPANILFADGKALVADFGVARAMTVAAGQEITSSGLAVGTPEYMSPEQATGERTIDHRSDIYALGCVVYEMIAGEPPFTGPSSQAVVARHCQEPPRSLRIIRPTVKRPVEDAVLRALAKVPADRFSSATAFVEALRTGAASRDDGETGRLRRRFSYFAAAVVAVTAGAFVIRGGVRGSSPPLDLNRIVVFPLLGTPSSDSLGVSGEQAATYIGYALEGTQPLKWLEGWELLDGRARANPGIVTSTDAAALTRRAGAGYFIDGSVVRGRDSVTVVLRLHSAGGDSLIRRAGAAGPITTAFVPALGLRAMVDLLPALLEPNRRIDLSALADRRPRAIANFLQGEGDYRRMRFDFALQHYRAAVKEDSSLAIAALRGAETANWRSLFGEDTVFARVALDHRQFLSPAQLPVALGLYAYLTGHADSAITHLRRAVALDSSSSATWMLLAEAYARLLPSEPNGDSLALEALHHARRVDPDFAPALLFLEGLAFVRGDLREADQLRAELRSSGADTTHAVERDLSRRCLAEGSSAIDWRRAAEEDPRSVRAVGKLLSSNVARQECARASFDALLDERQPVNERWGALFALQSMLAQRRRATELRTLFTSPGTKDLPVWSLYILDGLADSTFARDAATAVAERGERYETMGAPTLWLLASWESSHGDLVRARRAAAVLAAKADSSRTRRDRVLSDAVKARVTLASGDTAGAIRQLKSLSPSATRNDLAWQPWEALAGERLLLSRVLLARRAYREAFDVASQIDAREPIVHLLYLRPSLEIRLAAAERLADRRRASELRRRLFEVDGASRDVPRS